MACMVSFTLRESVYELEKPSHPSHHAWLEAMTLFRDMGRDDPPSPFSYGTPEDSYRCLNVPNPQEVMYLYREFPPPLKKKTRIGSDQAVPAKCSPEKIEKIEAACTSETSKLNQVLSPLLSTLLSAKSISKLKDQIDIHPQGLGGRMDKHMEFFHTEHQESPWSRFLFWHFRDKWCWSGCSGGVPTYKPMKSFSVGTLDGPEARRFYAIEWQDFYARTDLLSHHAREMLRGFNAKTQDPYLEELGKKEEDLTWKEDWDIAIKAPHGKTVERRLMIAKFVSDDYLGRKPGRSRQRREGLRGRIRRREFPCVIL